MTLGSAGLAARATRRLAAPQNGAYNNGMIKLLPRLALAALATSLCFGADTRFEISSPVSAMPGGITGRVYVMIAHITSPNTPAPNAPEREPRLDIGRLGVPFFGRDVEKLGAGQTAIVDASDLGSPVRSLSDIPPGEYWVQGFI